MKILSVEIQNFRSIKELYLELDDLVALVGPNSSGKTNVMKAIDLVLGEGWTTKAKVARELFNNPEKDIVIKIEFDGTINFTNKRGFDVSISTIELTLSLSPELSAKTTINGGETFYDQEQFKKICHFIYIPSERQLNSELRVSNWTMLGKLMKLVYENYVAFYKDEDLLKEEFAVKVKPAKDFLEDDFKDDTITYKKFIDSFKRHCKSNSAGLANDFEPVLDIYNINWFYKTLQIHVKEQHHDQYFDSEEVGAGMQNLLMLSIFQTYSELMGGKVIFGIEEPEIYLYPQAQRSLYKSLKELSKNTQILYTTHNPNFVDASRANDICLLRRLKVKGTFLLDQNTNILTPGNAEREKFKIYTHFNTERNELFFANKVLLVEGPSDKILWTTLLEEKWGIDIDKEGISIIECNGKGGVIYFIGVCRLCGIEDFFAVWDQDADEEYIDIHENLNYASGKKSGLEIPGNLEKFLKLTTGNKVKNAYEWASSINVEEIPEDFVKVKEFIMHTYDKEEVNESIIAKVFEDNDLPF